MNIFLLGIGIVIGGLITRVIFGAFGIGSLRIDTSDPDGPYLFLELNKDIRNFINKKYVVMKVNNKSYISHK